MWGLRFVVSVALGVCLSAVAVAQVTPGTILGNVRDSSGASVAGVQKIGPPPRKQAPTRVALTGEEDVVVRFKRAIPPEREIRDPLDRPLALVSGGAVLGEIVGA